MSNNWKKDLDDPNAEVKNALKKKRLYLLAFAFFPAFSGMIGFVETGLFYLFHIPVYGPVSMLIRYATAILGTVVAIRGIQKWRGQGRAAKAAYDETIMAKAVQEIMPGQSLSRTTVLTAWNFMCMAWCQISMMRRGAI